jgi:hypothetical protein
MHMGLVNRAPTTAISLTFSLFYVINIYDI